jgi:hypothetical protein
MLLFGTLGAATRAQAFQWPAGPTVSCKWSDDSHSLDVSFAWSGGSEQLADVIELGFAVEERSRPLAVYTVATLSLSTPSISVGLNVLVHGLKPESFTPSTQLPKARCSIRCDDRSCFHRPRTISALALTRAT